MNKFRFAPRVAVVGILAAVGWQMSAETIVPGVQPVAPVNMHEYNRLVSEPKKDETPLLKYVADVLKNTPKATPKRTQQEELEYSHKTSIDADKGGMGPNPDFLPATDAGKFSSQAEKCGVTEQKEHGPAKYGGRTMCGRAVAAMVKCMRTGGSKCSGGCGHGKDYVNCRTGFLENCGYKKISPTTDPRCKQAGALLAYNKGSNSPRGQTFGHVEFVCGLNKYCSVYKEPNTRPFMGKTPDGCYIPGGDGGGEKKK